MPFLLKCLFLPRELGDEYGAFEVAVEKAKLTGPVEKATKHPLFQCFSDIPGRFNTKVIILYIP